MQSSQDDTTLCVHVCVCVCVCVSVCKSQCQSSHDALRVVDEEPKGAGVNSVPLFRAAHAVASDLCVKSNRC